MHKHAGIYKMSSSKMHKNAVILELMTRLVTQGHSGLSLDFGLMKLVRLLVGGEVEWLCLAKLQLCD